jgi:hypothetical protein
LNVFDEIHAILRSRLEFQAGCITPQIFERVVGALFLRKNVNHHVAVVRHDPLALRESIHHERFEVVILPQAFLQFASDRFEVRFAGAGTNQEKIGERRDAAQVDGDDAFRLFIGGYFGTKLGETFGVDGSETFRN